MNSKPFKTWLLGGACLCLLAYLLGAYSYSRNLWPMADLRNFKQQFTQGDAPSLEETGRLPPVYDQFNRLISFPVDKEEVPCPAQDSRTIVLLLIGQSNAGNFHGQRHSSAYGERVINYFDGRCLIAASPLLGTSGYQGESWTLLGNKLLSAGMADQVILVPAGIGGSPISRWRDGGDLNGMLQSVLDDLLTKYRVTQVLWHQGESDLTHGTATADYERMFMSLVASLRQRGVDAPVLVSIATKCRNYQEWTPDNPVARAQASLADTGRNAGIYPGVNTDALMDFSDRHDDCHFSATGQEKFADGWIAALATAGTPE